MLWRFPLGTQPVLKAPEHWRTPRRRTQGGPLPYLRAPARECTGGYMPEQETLRRAHEDEREGKAPSTQAGEFVREEMHHIREGKHGARSPQQAIAIGLSKARRAGVKLPPPARGRASSRTRRQAQRDYTKGQTGRRRKTNPRRSRAVMRALKREPRSSASRSALSRQARSAARRRRNGR